MKKGITSKLLIILIILIIVLSSVSSADTFDTLTSDDGVVVTEQPVTGTDTSLVSEHAMFDVYKGERTLKQVGAQITKEEIFVWGYFLSNYVDPFALGDNSGYKIFMNNTEKKKVLNFGQPDFENTNKELLEKVIGYQFSAMYPVYKSENQIATFRDFIDGNVANTFYIKNKANANITVFNTGEKSSLYALFIALAKGKDNLEQNKYTTYYDRLIYVDGFGNLVFKEANSVTNESPIFIPAVLNPYTIDSTGKKLLFINDYFLSNYNNSLGNPNSVLTVEGDINFSLSNKNINLSNMLKNSMVVGGFPQTATKLLGSFSNNGYNSIAVTSTKRMDTVLNLRNVGALPLSVFFSNQKKGLAISIVNNFNTYKTDLRATHAKVLIEDSGLYGDTRNISTVNKESFYRLYNKLNELPSKIDNTNEFNLLIDIGNDDIKTSDYSQPLWGFLWKVDSELGTVMKKLEQRMKSVSNLSYSDKDLISNFAQFDTTLGTASNMTILQNGFNNNQMIKGLIQEYKNALDMMLSKEGILSNSEFISDVLWKKAELDYFVVNTIDYYTYKTLNMGIVGDFIKYFSSSSGSVDSLSSPLLVNLYYTYLTLYFGDKEGNSPIKGFNNDLMSELMSSNVYSEWLSKLIQNTITGSSSGEQKKEQITDWISGLLDPNNPQVRVQWIDGTSNTYLASIHYKLTNASKEAYGTGMKEIGYGGVNSFLTTPFLSQTPILAEIVHKYIYYYITILALFMVLTLVTMAIGLKEWKKTLFYFVIASIGLLLPPYLIENVVDLSNKAAEQVFSDKFKLWANAQHQEYLLDKQKSTSQEEQLLADQIQMWKGSKSATGILLKWNAPKKINVFNELYKKQYGYNQGKTIDLNIFKWVAAGMLQQEFYPSNDKYYVYRTYWDITKNAKDSYDKSVRNLVKATSIKNSKGEVLFEYRDLNQSRKAQAGDDYFAKTVNDFHLQASMLYNNGSPQLTPTDISSSILDLSYLEQNGLRNKNEPFLLITENIYYYFYYVLRDYFNTTPNMDLETESDLEEGFSNFLMTLDNYRDTSAQSKGYGQVKDFLDLENLFNNVIPYMYTLNNIVLEKLVSNELTDSDKMYYWGFYSQWVSVLYRSDYWKNNVLNAMGQEFRLQDGYSPKEYEKYREMLFSPAQQYSKGYNKVTRSQVEIKLHNILEKTYKDYMYLLNDLGYSDETLLSMAAMIATFNFNNEFSSYFLFKENALLYPMSFDLRDFSYDTFMKMFLMTATGETLSNNSDFYENIMAKSSILTGVGIIAVDFISIVILPNIRYIFILLLFLGGYLSIFKQLMSSDQEVKKITELIFGLLLKPLVIYGVVSYAHMLLLSALCGSSYNNFVGNKSTIILNSPNGTLFWVLGINTAYIVGLALIIIRQFKVLKKEVAGLFKHTGFLLSSALALAGGAIGIVPKTIKGINSAVRHKEQRNLRKLQLEHYSEQVALEKEARKDKAKESKTKLKPKNKGIDLDINDDIESSLRDLKNKEDHR